MLERGDNELRCHDDRGILPSRESGLPAWLRQPCNCGCTMNDAGERSPASSAAFRAFLRSLPDDVDRHGPFEMVFPAEPAEHNRRLLRTLGVAVVVEAGAEVQVRRATTPVAGPPEAREENTMTQQLDTVFCKAPDCTREAAQTHGRYAKLCEEHAEEAKQRDRAAGGATVAAVPSRPAGATAVTELVRKLVAPARRVDKARAKLTTTPRPEKAQAALQEAIRRVQEAPTTENLDRLVAATKQMKQGQPGRERARVDLADAERAIKNALTELLAELKGDAGQRAAA